MPHYTPKVLMLLMFSMNNSHHRVFYNLLFMCIIWTTGGCVSVNILSYHVLEERNKLEKITDYIPITQSTQIERQIE